MLVDFSRTEIDLETHVTMPDLTKDSIYECAAAAVKDPDSNVYIICAHQPVAGDHSDGIECWCCPDEIVFGAQPFLSVA